MPSAGRPLTARVIAELRARGVSVVAITHAAGLSSTGDPALDAVLTLPERTEVPDVTWAAVQAATRVVAVCTSVVRALESAARGVRSGRTTLRIGPSTKLLAVDALLTNVHAPGESHWELLRAFADELASSSTPTKRIAHIPQPPSLKKSIIARSSCSSAGRRGERSAGCFLESARRPRP